MNSRTFLTMGLLLSVNHLQSMPMVQDGGCADGCVVLLASKSIRSARSLGDYAAVTLDGRCDDDEDDDDDRDDEEE